MRKSDKLKFMLAASLLVAGDSRIKLKMAFP